MRRSGLLMCSALAAALWGCGADDAVDPSPAGAGGGTGAGGATGEGGATGGGGAGTGGEGGQGAGGGGGGGAGAPALSFVQAGTYPAATGAGNAGVVADDLDADGVPDLVVVNPPGGFVSVQGGAGDGTFQELHRGLVTTGLLTGELAITDLDHDGARDVIATARFGGVLIFAGQGDGALHPPVAVDAGMVRPGGVAAADLDGDGNDDLIVGSDASAGISVLKGNGDATFQPPVFLPVAGNHGLVGVAAGDLDGDGLLDVVAGDDATADLYFFKGAAGGALQPPSLVPAQNAQEVSLGDLDGDGSLDVVLSGSPFAPEIGVLLNHGDGTFHPLESYPGGNYASAVRIADVDADGAPDLLATDAEGLYVMVLLNAGGGAFQGAAPYAAGRFPQGIAVADLDGDAHLDLAVGNDGPGLSVLPGNGDGTFQPPAGAALGSGARALLVSDLDGDGALDLALGDDGSAAISVLRGSGGGLFEPAAAFPTGDDPLQLAAGRFDGDPLLDLAVASECGLVCATVETVAGAGDGTFQPPVTSYYGPVLSFDAADLNGDGTTDLVVALDETGPLAVMLGNGDGTVSEDYLSIGADAFTLADVDADGHLDLLGAVEFVSFVLRGNGDGTFQDPGQLYLMDDLTSDLAAADFNADGLLDFVAVSRQDDFLTVMLGAAEGGFTPEVIHLNSGRLGPVVPADLDGDGWIDLALIAKGRVTVLLNERGAFVGGPSFAAGLRTSSLAVADVDGDQWPDLIATGYSSNDVTVLLNTTP